MLVSKRELTNLKLKSIKSDNLKELAESLSINSQGTAADLIKKLIDISQNKIDEFIKKKYQEEVEERQKLISDNDLKQELMKVKEFK